MIDHIRAGAFGAPRMEAPAHRVVPALPPYARPLRNARAARFQTVWAPGL